MSTIIPTIIELDADLVEIKNQYTKEQLTNPIIIFGQKYVLKEFTMQDPQYPDLRKTIVKLGRFTDIIESEK